MIFEHIGTPAYLAPEIITEKGYKDFGVDIWSLGVMTYIALTGLVPFSGANLEKLNNDILMSEVDIDEACESLSFEWKFLI